MHYHFQNEKGEHFHWLDDKRLMGTSTIINEVIAKPLTWWAASKALEPLGWTNPKLVPREEGIKIAGKARKNFFIKNAEYYDWLQECYKAHDVRKKEAAVAGTDLHAVLEDWVKWKMGKKSTFQTSPENEKRISPFIEWATRNVKSYLWSEAHCYSERLWCGGISDLGVELLDGRYAVVDFKSSKAAYDSHWIQAAGYAIQIDENGLWSEKGEHNKKLDKEISALIIVPFGADTVTPQFKWNISDYKKGFEAAVTLYRLINEQIIK